MDPISTELDGPSGFGGRLRALSVAVTAALVVTAALAGVGTPAAGSAAANSAAQAAGYTVSVELPGDFTTDGRQTVRVAVENTADEALFNPVVEVPLPSGLSVDSASVASARVRLPDGSAEDRTAELDASTFRSGRALFVNGESIPAGTEHVYEFEVGVPSAGNKTVEAVVRPLYNTDLSARDEASAYAAGFGTVNVTVQRPDGSPVTGADVTVDGESVGTGATPVVEGRHAVAVSGTALALPSFSPTVGVGEAVRLTYTVPGTLTEPTVVATDRGATVVGGSAGESSRSATASRAASYDLGFVVDASGGRTLVALPVPGDVPESELGRLTATADRGSVTLSRVGEVVLANVSADADATVRVAYAGERLGDASGDGAVTGADASAVAGAVADGSARSAYADVNGDGTVNAVDAMLIAQYASGERDDSYALAGGD